MAVSFTVKGTYFQFHFRSSIKYWIMETEWPMDSEVRLPEFKSWSICDLTAVWLCISVSPKVPVSRMWLGTPPSSNVASMKLSAWHKVKTLVFLFINYYFIFIASLSFNQRTDAKPNCIHVDKIRNERILYLSVDLQSGYKFANYRSRSASNYTFSLSQIISGHFGTPESREKATMAKRRGLDTWILGGSVGKETLSIPENLSRSWSRGKEGTRFGSLTEHKTRCK